MTATRLSTKALKREATRARELRGFDYDDWALWDHGRDWVHGRKGKRLLHKPHWHRRR